MIDGEDMRQLLRSVMHEWMSIPDGWCIHQEGTPVARTLRVDGRGRRCHGVACNARVFIYRCYLQCFKWGHVCVYSDPVLSKRRCCLRRHEGSDFCHRARRALPACEVEAVY